jgi:hypothetical protein
MRSLLLAIAVSLAFVATAPAQGVNGSLSGTLLDTQGAAIAGSTVTAKNIVTGVLYSTKTEPSGDFAILNLPPRNVFAGGGAGRLQEVPADRHHRE